MEKLPTDSPSVAILWTSIVDAWLEYQKKQLVILEEAVRHGDSTVVLRDRLEEICYAAESASELVEKELHDKKVSSHHVLMILKAWATACQATRMAGLTTSKAGDWSGIPQRAQHILTQYQLITGQKPTTESINQVLKAWAYSGEHLRGTMAEQFFAKQKDTNGETLRIMIRAWSWSNEKRDAFAANGYFLRMMRLLELGETEMEPTLEDYRILFQAWATAE